LWPIAQTEDELQTDQEDGDIAQDDEDVFPDMVAEWVDGGICEGAGDEVKGEIEVGEGEEGEEE
jgi:hypothetical protein